MIYYYYKGGNEQTFTEFKEARENAIKDGVPKFRDTQGGEYFI